MNKIYYGETSSGTTLVIAVDQFEARKAIKREIGSNGDINTVRRCTQSDFQWVAAMGGWTPSGFVWSMREKAYVENQDKAPTALVPTPEAELDTSLMEEVAAVSDTSSILKNVKIGEGWALALTSGNVSIITDTAVMVLPMHVVNNLPGALEKLMQTTIQRGDTVRLAIDVQETHRCPEGRENNALATVLSVADDGAVQMDRDLHGCLWWNKDDLILMKKGNVG